MLAADAHLFDVKPVTLAEEAGSSRAGRQGAADSEGGVRGAQPAGGDHGSLPDDREGRGEGRGDVQGPEREGDGLYLGKDAPGLDSVVFEVKEPGEYTITLKAGDVTQTRKVDGREWKPADEGGWS